MRIIDFIKRRNVEKVKPITEEQQHLSKNWYLTPHNVTNDCKKKVWWIYTNYDPSTHKHTSRNWQETVEKRYLVLKLIKLLLLR